MKGKKIIMHIKIDDRKIRNEMHFEAQLKNRMQIFENKKKYKRCRAKQETIKIVRDLY